MLSLRGDDCFNGAVMTMIQRKWSDIEVYIYKSDKAFTFVAHHRKLLKQLFCVN